VVRSRPAAVRSRPAVLRNRRAVMRNRRAVVRSRPAVVRRRPTKTAAAVNLLNPPAKAVAAAKFRNRPLAKASINHPANLAANLLANRAANHPASRAANRHPKAALKTSASKRLLAPVPVD